jgi:hypothetical protein
MTTKEQVNRNIGLSFDFLKQVIKNPDLLDSVKNGTTIDFIEKDFKKVKYGSRSKRTKYFKVKSYFEDLKAK